MASFLNRRAFAAVALAVGLSCLVVTGCEGSGSDSGCGAEESGERIELHNSGIGCEEANALVNVTANRNGPQKIKSGNEVWVCTYLPARYLPIRIRCIQGKRFFTLVDTD